MFRDGHREELGVLLRERGLRWKLLQAQSWWSHSRADPRPCDCACCLPRAHPGKGVSSLEAGAEARASGLPEAAPSGRTRCACLLLLATPLASPRSALAVTSQLRGRCLKSVPHPRAPSGLTAGREAESGERRGTPGEKRYRRAGEVHGEEEQEGRSCPCFKHDTGKDAQLAGSISSCRQLTDESSDISVSS